MDINERVLAAFQAEHKEHIEGIRALLAQLREDAWQAGDERLDEAFRLAHSLKGGARVCDLPPAEQLGHRLESLFSAVRQGELAWRSDVQSVVNHVLDSIEDWMAALTDNGQPPDVGEALASINRLLGEDAPESQPSDDSANATLAGELHDAFAEEYAVYVNTLRQFLAEEPDSRVDEDFDAEKAFLQAHNLQSAAGAAELSEVEKLSKKLAIQFARLRQDPSVCDEEFRRTSSSLLDEVEAAIQGFFNGAKEAIDDTNQAAKPPAAPSGERKLSGTQRAAAAGEKSAAAHETVRVETTSLDNLIRCSGQLLSDLSDQDEMARALDALGRDLDTMRRERESLRHAASTSFHRLANAPEHGRVFRYFNALDRQLESIGRRTHILRRLQGRHEWLLRNRGEQVHRYAKQARMVPAESVFQGFRKLVRDLAKDEGKQVEFSFSGLQQQADRLVLQALKDPLMHVLRNSVVHGIELPQERASAGKSASGAIGLTVEAIGNRLRITATDDGRGLDWKAIRAEAVKRGLLTNGEASDTSRDLTEFVLQAGFTTSRHVSELAGRGMGLSVLHEAVTRLQGRVRIQSSPELGTQIEFDIPLSVSTHRFVLVLAGRQTYAIPVGNIDQLIRVPIKQIQMIEGSPFVTHQEKPVPLASLTNLLGGESSSAETERSALAVIILKTGVKNSALVVDALLAEREALIHKLTGPAARVPYYSGAVHLGNGDVALVLDAAELGEQSNGTSGVLPDTSSSAVQVDKASTILVVDDSFTTRTLEKSILEAHGYNVHIAVDGVEALSLLRSQCVDLVIADVEMPRMDGFELLAQVRSDARLSRMPLILVTSRDKTEDREHGLQLGADAYIFKQKFDHQNLLDTIQQML